MFNQQDQLPKFILGVNNGYARLPLKWANAVLGNKRNLHRMLTEQGFYLPRVDSRACTGKYLFSVISGSVFSIKTSQVRTCLEEKTKLSKIDLLSLLQTLVGSNVNLGFSPISLPDRSWILNVVYTYSPENEIFTGIDVVDKIVEIPIS